MGLVDFKLIDYVGSADSRMVTFFPGTPEQVDGVSNLIQRIIKRIFTIEGSDAFNTKIGTNFYGLFTALSLDEAKQFKNTFSILLKDVEEELINEQNDYSNLSDYETLQELSVESIEYDETFGGWLISINVLTNANNSILVTI